LAATGLVIFVMPNFGMTLDATNLISVLSNPEFYAVLFCSIVLIRLLCAPYWIWRDEYVAKLKAQGELRRQVTLSLVHLSIAKVMFDRNGPSEYYVDFEVLNPTSPTILKNWQLFIKTATLTDPLVVTPRFITTDKFVKDAYGPPRSDDMASSPIEQGGKRIGRLGFTFQGSAKDTIGESAASFELTVEDVLARKIIARYSCDFIPTP